MVRGWAFGIMDRSINVCSGSENRRRVDETVIMFDDECKVGSSGGFITPSSIIHDTDVYVVWVTRDGPPGSSYEYRVSWRDRRCNFGGAHGCASLEEAIEVFDRVRGRQEQQQTLF